MKKIALVLCVFALAGCDESEDPNTLISQLADKKAKAESVINSREMRFEDQVTMKEYFSDIASIAIWSKKYPDKANKFLQGTKTKSIDSACSDLLISTESWTELMSRCQYSGYFICAEEVRVYKNAVNNLVENLNEQNRRSFQASKYCPNF